MLVKLLSLIVIVLSISGCASLRKDTRSAQTQELQTQVTKLKEELRQKNEEVNSLQWQLREAQRPKAASGTVVKAKTTGGDIVKMTPKNLQLALKKAGFYDGPVDGKIGKRTKQAIVDFQKANGLTADGVTGEKTWSKLKKYLE
ncbi:MAG: peptidoglycan-binding domain-containing protein [Candidatus Omnitrophota bacterium]